MITSNLKPHAHTHTHKRKRHTYTLYTYTRHANYHTLGVKTITNTSKSILVASCISIIISSNNTCTAYNQCPIINTAYNHVIVQ